MEECSSEILSHRYTHRGACCKLNAHFYGFGIWINVERHY